jgi:hypothetical protein
MCKDGEKNMKKPNIIKKLLIVIPSLVLIPLIQNCGGAQTDINDISVRVGTETATVSDTESTNLSISGGSASGTDVVLPAGALPTGSTLSLTPASDPDAFDLDVIEEAGASINLTATSSSGSSISDLTTPMTLSLPISSTSLALFSLVEKSDANLCVLLSSGSSLIVWRSSAISLSTLDGKRVAQISSLKLGIFKLVYCGTETLSGFQDANDAGAAGGSFSTVNISIDTSTYGLGANKICVAALADSTPDSSGDGGEGDGPDVMMGGTEIVVDGSTVTADFDAYTSVVPDGSHSFLVLLYIDSSQSCPSNTPTSNWSPSTVEFNNLMGFPLEVSTLEANPSVNIDIGTGDYSLMQVTMQMGTIAASYTDTDICVNPDNDDNGPYFAEFSSTLNAAGNQIDSAATKTYLIPANSSTTADTYEMKVRVGAACNSHDDTVPTYDIAYENVTASSLLKIDSLDLSFTSAGLTGQSGCLEFWNIGASSASGNQPLLEADLTEGQAGVQYFFPFQSTYSVDLVLYSGGCQSKGVSFNLPTQDASTAPFSF